MMLTSYWLAFEPGQRIESRISEFLGTDRYSLSNFGVFRTNNKISVPHCLHHHKKALYKLHLRNAT